MNQKQRAEGIGISDRKLREYENERGCPKTWPECKEWYDRNIVARGSGKAEPGDLNEETARLRAAQADLAEMEAAQQRAELVPLDDVRIGVGELLVSLRRDMEAISGRTALTLSSMVDPGEIRDYNLGEIRQALAAAAHRLEAMFRAWGAGEPAETAAEEKPGPVG